jgi:nitrite reductase/ring-hydroxylating ferredoxin subunit
MTEKHVVGSLEEFPVGTPRICQVGRREIGIFNISGRLYGLPNVCPHQTGPLCEAPRLTGTVASSAESNWQLRWVHDGEIVRCPWHGMEFHVPTGQCLAHREVRLRSYDIVVEDGTVSVLI